MKLERALRVGGFASAAVGIVVGVVTFIVRKRGRKAPAEPEGIEVPQG